jgi:hypothetical protein
MPFTDLIVPIDQLIRATARTFACTTTIDLLDLPGRHLHDLPRLDRLDALRSELAGERDDADTETGIRLRALWGVLDTLGLDLAPAAGVEGLARAAAEVRSAGAAAEFAERFQADLLLLPDAPRRLLGALGSRHLDLSQAAREGADAIHARARDLERELDALAESEHGRVDPPMSAVVHNISGQVGELAAAYTAYPLGHQLMRLVDGLRGELRGGIAEDDPRFEAWGDILRRSRGRAETLAAEAWADASLIREQRLPALFAELGGER